MLGRSVSHQLDESKVDSQKLLKFRLWLDSYQKWKQLHCVPSEEMSCENGDVPPVKSVVTFIKNDITDAEQLLEIM
jgi:other hect domain ubiquitin protein ligase E3